MAIKAIVTMMPMMSLVPSKVTMAAIIAELHLEGQAKRRIWLSFGKEKVDYLCMGNAISEATKENIALSERSYIDLYCKRYEGIPFPRYFDDELRDMYDHNFSEFPVRVTEDDLEIIKRIKTERGEDFIKISCHKKSLYLCGAGFEEEALLTLAKEDYLSFDVPPLDFVAYKRGSEHPELFVDLIKTEKEYYGPEYGESFCERRWLRDLGKIKEGGNGLDAWAVYDKEKIIGYCYSYFDHDVVCIDGLLVIKEYRNRYVASNLIKTIANYYACPIYLHASEDDTPKELYYKLGFEKVGVVYDYLRVDEKE